MNRRDFLTGCGLLAASSVCGNPVKELLSPRHFLEGLWTPTAADYIQDGLVCMWDAIENGGPGIHNPGLNKNTWVEWCGTGWKMDMDRGGFFEDDWFGQTEIRTAYNHYVSSALTQFFNGVYTWETVLGEVYSEPSMTSRENFMGTYGRMGDGNAFRDISSYYPSTETTGSLDTYPSVHVSSDSWLKGTHAIDRSSLTAHYSLHANGVLVSQRNRTLPDSYTNQYIYCQPIAHKFHCMRIYNRILSEKELQYNMLVDKVRFNLH